MGQFSNVMLLLIITAAMAAITTALALLFDGIPVPRSETSIANSSGALVYLRSALIQVLALHPYG
jgi:hypothetical protein